MSRPVAASPGMAGIRRPDPRAARWSAADLARRRALVTARAELAAAEARGDGWETLDAWRSLVGVLARAELARLAGER